MSQYPKKVSDNRWIIEVKENSETKELYLEFPEGALDQVGWDIGDEIIWNELPNGAWSLTKKVDKNEQKDLKLNNG